MVDFPGLVTAVNNMISWLWYMMNLYKLLQRINYNLYGGMNYLSIQPRIQLTHVCRLVSQIVHI